MFKKANNLSTIKNIRHGFFSKLGGVSSGIYESLNVGFGSDDYNENVIKNRKIVEKKLKADFLFTVKQCHSNKVITLSNKENISIDEQINLKKNLNADGIVTDIKNAAIGTLSADCGCILFVDKLKDIIGCCHAGWKGAFNGIIENTISTMVKMGSNIDDIIVASGPCISKESYEVGKEFYQTFIDKNCEYENLFIANDNKYFFDLKKYIETICISCGIKNFEYINDDTYNLESLYYSYRRSCHKMEKDYGRQISAIVLKK